MQAFLLGCMHPCMPRACRRLAGEAGTLASQLREGEEMRQVQHRMHAELAAEVQRLAAEAALGPVMVLDEHGNVSGVCVCVGKRGGAGAIGEHAWGWRGSSKLSGGVLCGLRVQTPMAKGSKVQVQRL